jgi:tetratricopeptide (TPR) repeat protein
MRYLSFISLAFIVLMALACTAETKTLTDEGYKFWADGNYEQSISAYSEAIELDPENAAAYKGRGVTYYFWCSLGNSPSDSCDKALDDFYKVVELKGDRYKPPYEQADLVQIAEGFLVRTYEEIACNLDNKYCGR